MKPTWEREGIKLFHGDCRDVLPHLSGVDAVVTDPPYGISHSSSYGASWQNTRIEGDTDTTVRDEVLATFAEVAAFGTWKTPPIDGTHTTLVWDKGPAFGMGDLSIPWKPSWELVYIKGRCWRGRRDEGVLRGHLQVSWESRGRCHPHQKPVSLLAAIIGKRPKREVLLDPFMGSGTTGVAAVQMVRKFIGIEKEEKYFGIAVKRIEAELDRAPLFKAPQEVQVPLFGDAP